MYEKLKKLSADRMRYFASNMKDLVWYKGSENYFDELPNELQEAKEEDKINNHVHLEDELWDVFWNYLMLLQSLKHEWKIRSIDSVIERAYSKFSERVGKDGHYGTEDQLDWETIKKWQKARLKKEHQDKYWK